MNEDYVAGFMAKAAELGVDPEALLVKTAVLYNAKTRQQWRHNMQQPDYANFVKFKKGQPMILGPGVTFDRWRQAGSPADFATYRSGLTPKDQRFWDGGGSPTWPRPGAFRGDAGSTRPTKAMPTNRLRDSANKGIADFLNSVDNPEWVVDQLRRGTVR